MKKIINLLIFFTCVTSYSQVTLEWVKRYDDTTQGQDNPIKVLTDKQNNVYVTGSFNGYIGTIKYNSSGAQQWVRYYKWQSNPYSDLRAAIIDKDSNLYLAARGGDLFNNRYDCVLIKYNSQGNVVWEKNYGGTGAWSPNALVIDRDKNICVTGTTSYNNLSIFLLKYTPQGDTVWTKLYKFPGYQSNYGEAIAIDSLNNIIISGGAKQTGY